MYVNSPVVRSRLRYDLKSIPRNRMMDRVVNKRVLFMPALLVGAALSCFAATAGSGPSAWVGDFSPIPAADWNYDRAAHLLERAGFGGTPEEIEALAAM